jgi:hypothetical protein
MKTNCRLFTKTEVFDRCCTRYDKNLDMDEMIKQYDGMSMDALLDSLNLANDNNDLRTAAIIKAVMDKRVEDQNKMDADTP